jgi:D-arabinose 1-dehydrogenase-like Zn-dependent alcohol dehydrogenase
MFSAAVMPAPGKPIRLERFPAPDLAEGAALLRVRYSEVCGTDVHLHHGRLSGVPYPIIPGHVSVGEIAEMGGGLTDIEGRPFALGDRVTFLDVHETCGRCYQCLVARQSTRCPHRKVYGITYSAREGLLGGWSEAVWIKPGVHLVRLPDELDETTFIGGGCGLITALHAIDRAELRLGQSVAVLGVGPVGQSIIALAALSGADRVIGVGAPEPRLAFAQRMGATDVLGLGIDARERLEAVRSITDGRGVDVVIEASGAPDAVPQALDLVRDGGRVVICGHYTDNGDVRVHPHWQINRKHVEIRGCWGSDYSHVHRAVRIAAKHGDHVPWRDMIGARYPLERAGEALGAVERQEVTKALIVPGGTR